MKRKLQSLPFGETVQGYAVPVLNEREIRAAAGLMFLALFVSFLQILFKEDFQLVKHVIVVFLIDFSLRVFISPRFSPLLIIGRLVVSRQVPEYVEAAPKKFAWQIGTALSALMVFLLVVFNTYSVITVASCLLCLVFLFFESSFGICFGCLFYALLFKEKLLHCPGQACAITKREGIQEITWTQMMVVFVFAAFVLVLSLCFHQSFHSAPTSLWKQIGFK